MAASSDFGELRSLLDRVEQLVNKKVVTEECVRQEVRPKIISMKWQMNELLEMLERQTERSFSCREPRELVELKRCLTSDQRAKCRFFIVERVLSSMADQSRPLEWQRIGRVLNERGFKVVTTEMCKSLFRDCICNYNQFLQNTARFGKVLDPRFKHRDWLDYFRINRNLFDIDLKPFVNTGLYKRNLTLKKDFISIADKILIESQLRDNWFDCDKRVVKQFLNCFAFVNESLELHKLLIETMNNSPQKSVKLVVEEMKNCGHEWFDENRCRHEFQVMTSRYIFLLDTCDSVQFAADCWPLFQDLHSLDFSRYFKSDIVSKIENLRNSKEPKFYIAPNVMNKFCLLRDKIENSSAKIKVPKL